MVTVITSSQRQSSAMTWDWVINGVTHNPLWPTESSDLYGMDLVKNRERESGLAERKLERNDHGSFTKTLVSIIDMLRKKRKWNHIKCSFKTIRDQKKKKSGKQNQEQRTRATNRKQEQMRYLSTQINNYFGHPWSKRINEKTEIVTANEKITPEHMLSTRNSL